jgi:DNA-binding NarL/FixJ family response regulator
MVVHRDPTRISTVLARAKANAKVTTAPRPVPRNPLRVAIADDSYLVREALAAVISHIDGTELVASCADGDELVSAVEATDADVAIVDLRMPPAGEDEGISVAARLRERRPGVGVIALSQFAGAAYALDLLAGGAEGRGYLLKERIRDANELGAAITTVAEGGTVIDPMLVRELLATDRARASSPVDELTPRELQVLAEMAEGKSNAAIADSLTLTKRAVEKHVGQIFQKLGLEDDEVVSRRVTAVLLFLSSPPS